MSSINWPDLYLPGKTDFFISNECIVSGIQSQDAWVFLADTRRWAHVYNQLSDIVFLDETGPILQSGSRFSFTVGGLVVQAEITEYQEPSSGVTGRLSWHGWVENGGVTVVDAWCGWIIEDLYGERTRILWQETLLGEPAKDMARQKPNPALLSHQEWVDGIANAAQNNSAN